MAKMQTVYPSPKRLRSKSTPRSPKKVSIPPTLLPPIDEEIEAYEETIKETIKNEEENRKKLRKLEEKGSRQLLHIKSVFPFTLFPDEIIIDENKVTVIIYSFFSTKNARSILIKDIANVSVQTTIMFATLQLVDQYFTQDTIAVKYLKVEEATLARRLIQGLMVSREQQVDYTNIPLDEVKKRLEHIGRIIE